MHPVINLHQIMVACKVNINRILVPKWWVVTDNNNNVQSLERLGPIYTCPILIIKIQIQWLHLLNCIRMVSRARAIKTIHEVFPMIKNSMHKVLLARDLDHMLCKLIQIWCFLIKNIISLEFNHTIKLVLLCFKTLQKELHYLLTLTQLATVSHNLL